MKGEDPGWDVSLSIYRPTGLNFNQVAIKGSWKEEQGGGAYPGSTGSKVGDSPGLDSSPLVNSVSNVVNV